jgi:DNA polymerase III delta prime subunit
MSKAFFATIDKPIGYDKILDDLSTKIKERKFYPVNLISGEESIGKRGISNYLAHIIIGASIEKFSDITNHPDILIIESKKDNIKKEITIEQIRELKNFVKLTPAQAQNKVIIIDAIDQLNINAANAVLKILEEPNQNIYFLLINHNSDIIMATIKSRCHKISLPRLSKKDFFDILNKNNIISEAELLYNIFSYKAGQAINFYRNQGLEMLEIINEFLINKKSLTKQIFIDKFDFKANPNSFKCFMPIINYLLLTESKKQQQDSVKLDKLSNFLTEFNSEYYQVISLNMDNYNFILNNLFKIEKIL